MNEQFDSFDILALSFGYIGSKRGSPADYYSHPTLGHEIEVHQACALEKQWWRWRPGPQTMTDGVVVSEPYEWRPHSGMSCDGLKALLSRIHNGENGGHCG